MLNNRKTTEKLGVNPTNHMSHVKVKKQSKAKKNNDKSLLS
jgi:hypothetical protein